MDDRRIIELLLARSEEALTVLASRYGNGLLRLARSILRSDHDAEETVSDIYLAIWNAIPPAQPNPLAPYVYRTGRNIALKRLRHDTAQKRSAYEISLDELAGCIPGPALEDTVTARALGRAIDRWLASQSRENRVIFLRRYWFGDSVKDIAAMTGLRENAVSVRLNRLKNKLKDHLIEEGFYE